LVRPLRTSWLIVGNEVNVPTLPQDTNRQVYGGRALSGNLDDPRPVGPAADRRCAAPVEV